MNTAARSAWVVVLAVLAFAGVVPTAQAKGPTDVVVSGPGIDDVHLTFTEPEDVDSGTLGDASRLYDMWSPGRLAPAPDLTAEQLGPEYELTWSARHGMDAPETVVQLAYPFAEGGGWIYFPGGQELWGSPLATGWVRTPRIEGQLVALGARDERPAPALAASAPPAAADSPVATEPTNTGPTSTGPTSTEQDSRSAYDVAVPAGALAAGVLVVAGVLIVRRRQLSR